ncbi:MAG: DegV family protein [Lachnospiraceae bacterium]|nr:DegV family protein [Lachnospiraceae bacterium]
MKKIAVITDTSSGITIEEGKQHGFFVIPMPITIDNKEFHDNVDITFEDFYKAQASGADIHTSTPAAGTVLDLWNECLKTYDEIVYIPLSSGLSSSCVSAEMLAEDYDGKVQVVNNQRIAVTQRQSVYDALALAKNGRSAAEIKKILEDAKFDSSIYIMLDTLEYLKKGGRITPAAATFAKILNLKPVLQIHGEKLDAFSKSRGIKQAKKVLLNAVKDDVEKRLGGYDPSDPNIWFEIAHTQNEAAAEEFKQDVLSVFPNAHVHIDPLPLVIAVHIGPGSLAFACSKVIPEAKLN